MIKNMLTNPTFGYKQYFGENIIVFSKTLGLDETWTSLKLPKTHYYREWDDLVVREIMDYSRKQPRGVLLLLDDLISDAGAFNRRNNNLLTFLIVLLRSPLWNQPHYHDAEAVSRAVWDAHELLCPQRVPPQDQEGAGRISGEHQLHR